MLVYLGMLEDLDITRVCVASEVVQVDPSACLGM